MFILGEYMSVLFGNVLYSRILIKVTHYSGPGDPQMVDRKEADCSWDKGHCDNHSIGDIVSRSEWKDKANHQTNDLSDFTIVIPTLNEEDSIGAVIDEILSLGLKKEDILLVDGGSTDNTLKIAESRGVKVIMQEGSGKADAIKSALKQIKTRYAVFMDGDYTYPAKHIIDLLKVAKCGGYDEVIGSRQWGRENIPIVNRLGNWMLNKLFSLLFNFSIKDVLSGMYVIDTLTVGESVIEMKGFSIESEIAAHVISTTGKITEIPINYRKRIGKKKLKLRHGLSIARDMIRLAWRYNPAFFIFSLGALLLIPGILLGGWVAYRLLFNGVKHHYKGLIAIMLVLTGVQSSLLAVMALFIKRVERRFIERIEAFNSSIVSSQGQNQDKEA